MQSPSRSRSKKVNKIIARARRAIIAADRQAKSDMESYEGSKEIIKSTLIELYRLEGQDPDKVNDGSDDAVKRDRDYVVKSLRYQAPSSPAPFSLISIDTQQPFHYSPDKIFTRYREIMWYLVINCKIAEPHLWVAQERVHTYTKSGTQWIHRGGTDKVESGDVHFLSAANNRRYIVALVQRQDQQGEEALLALDIVPYGASGPCRTLLEHLNSVWGHLEILNAGRIVNDDMGNPLGDPYDESNFDPSIHDLWFHCESRPAAD